MTLRERLKKVQALLLAALASPLLPSSVRAALGEVSLLLTALVEDVEQLKKERER